jgi:hypothetical protein
VTLVGTYEVLTCDPGGGVLAGGEDVNRILLSFRDGRAAAVVGLPVDAMIVGACDAGAWVGRSLQIRADNTPIIEATTPVWFVDRGVQHRSSTVTVPGDYVQTALDGCTLWVLSTSRLQPAGWTITEVVLAGGA